MARLGAHREVCQRLLDQKRNFDFGGTGRKSPLPPAGIISCVYGSTFSFSTSTSTFVSHLESTIATLPSEQSPPDLRPIPSQPLVGINRNGGDRRHSGPARESGRPAINGPTGEKSDW